MGTRCSDARRVRSEPEQNVYNVLDSSDDVARQAALNFQGPVGGGFYDGGEPAYRSDEAETLTTGRAATVFGGFFPERLRRDLE
jgi:hypothetical protein